LKDKGDGRVEYAFYEADGEGTSARQYAAKLEIDRSQPTSLEAGTEAVSVEAFQTDSRAKIDSGGFYEKLRENGNQYGPSFQRVSSIWRVGNQSLGRLSVARQGMEIEPHFLHPALLDSMTQLLATFVMEQGRTFILRSIEKLEVADVNFPDAVWGHATLLPGSNGNGNDFAGNIRVFDDSGKAYLELSGVAFSLLDAVDIAHQKPAPNLFIASNFTAEPLEDCLKFWGDHFGVPIHLEFAPYNQIFQQLLDAGSLFRRNSDGVNAILLR
jgi:hypothetical protein